VPVDPSSEPRRSDEDARRKAPPVILWLRVAGLGVSVGLVAVVGRVVNVLPWHVAFLLAVTSALMWSYKFDR
jgi:hypothetical protein